MDNPLNSIILIMMLPYLMQMLSGLGGGQQQQQPYYPGPQPIPGVGYGYGPGQIAPKVVLMDPEVVKRFPGMARASDLIR